MAACFRVYTATDPERLGDLAALLIGSAAAAGAADDLRALPVLVPALPVRDRLVGDLARRLGVCAGIEVLLPAEFVHRWLPARLGVGGRAWDAGAARWRLADRLGAVPGLDLAPTWDGRRLALADRVLDALTRCDLWAPAQTTLAWAQGGAGDPALPSAAWLPAVWRALVADPAIGDPGARLRALSQAAATADDLPPLILAWQTNALAPPVLEVLRVLGTRTTVVVLLLQPSDVEVSDHVRRRAAVAAGAEDALGWNRLLGEWGAEHRATLARFAEAGADIAQPQPGAAPPTTLLARVQMDLALGRGPAEAGPWPLAAGDDSLVFQHAYGRRGELEALKRRLAAWCCSAGAPAPHEIAIACPDPAALAPLLAAIFATGGDGPPLPVDLRAPLEADPAFATAARLLDLLPGRWPASAVLDLCASAAVAEGHGLSGTDLGTLRDWCEDADLRFGVDAAHRSELQLGGFAGASWRRGLTRLALGAWLGADAGALPAWPAGGDPAEDLPAVGDLDESAVGTLRRVAHVLLPLLDAAADWRQPQPPSWWAQHVPRLVRHARGDGARDHHDAAIADLLARWATALKDLGLGAAPVGAALVAALIAEADPAGQVRSVRRGGIAVGTPSALRGVPWRIVCLVGFDDGAYPRQAASDVDPLARARPPGVPDARSEDRGALLDLLVGARDRVLVSWSGHDVRKGEATPPATVVADLLEVVAQTAGADACQQLTTRVGVVAAQAALAGVGAGAAWPSAAMAEQARVLAGARREAAGLRSGAPLPALGVTSVDLSDLLRFFDHPPRAFLRRLGIVLPEAEAAATDHERFDLGGPLQIHQLRKEGCDQASAADELVRDWQRRGRIPAGALGRQLAWPLIAQADALRADSDADRVGSVTREVRVDLGHGRRLIGVSEPGREGLGPVLIHPGKHSLKYLVRTWIHGLAWQAMGGTGAGRCWQLTSACKPKAWDVPAPLAADGARALLQALVATRDAGLRRPLPLLPDLVEAWAKAADDAEGLDAARQCWSAEAQPAGQPPARHDQACRRIWPEPVDPFADAATAAACCAAMALLRAVAPPPAAAQGAGA